MSAASLTLVVKIDGAADIETAASKGPVWAVDSTFNRDAAERCRAVGGVITVFMPPVNPDGFLAILDDAVLHHPEVKNLVAICDDGDQRELASLFNGRVKLIKSRANIVNI